MTVQETIARAWSQYQSGDRPGAEEAFRHLVQSHPDSADAWCYLGIVRRGRGDLEGALAGYREAVRLRPAFLEAHNNLGNVLVLLNRPEEAVACYRAALRLRPDYPDAHNNLGAALRTLGRLDEAVACYRAALRLKPDYADAHNNLGDAFARLGKPEEAVPHYQHALRLRPDYVEAHNNLGAALTRLGKPEEAIVYHRQALRLKPDFADAYNNLANALLKQKKLAEAVAAYREALRLKPDYAEAYSNLGIALVEGRDWDGALACYDDALRLKPDYPEALTNKGNVLVECGRPDAALACYERALALKPEDAEAYHNLAQAFLALGRLPDAMACFGKALEVRPDYPEAHMGRALTRLVQGDYEQGWAEYEWRWKCREFTLPPYRQPAWDGASLQGRTILLHAEQGLGDTIQFVRYAPLVKSYGGSVILTCQKPLLRLLAGCPGVDRFVAQGEDLPLFDVHAPLLSLPRLFGTTVATVPATVPYLSANPALVECWRRELSAFPGFKVGIAWQGNPQFGADRQRSFPLAHFEALARLPGVRLFSLQKGHGSEQTAAATFPLIDLEPRLDEESGPFADTAAVMKNLDLVICPNTALAHLAGALAVPLWLPLPLAPEWRWLWGRTDSPWYPTARVFRQERGGDWTGVFGRLAEALRPLAAAPRLIADCRLQIADWKTGEPESAFFQSAICNLQSAIRGGTVAVEISPGELLDKISILQIKSVRLTDPVKLANVRRELEGLQAVRDGGLTPSAELEALAAELRAVNEALWEVEDGLRRCERTHDFGTHFVELARSACQHNDRRVALKRRINERLGSALVEEERNPAAPGPG